MVYTCVTLSIEDSDGFMTIAVTGSLTSSRGMASAAAVMGSERQIHTYTTEIRPLHACCCSLSASKGC